MRRPLSTRSLNQMPAAGYGGRIGSLQHPVHADTLRIALSAIILITAAGLTHQARAQTFREIQTQPFKVSPFKVSIVEPFPELMVELPVDIVSTKALPGRLFVVGQKGLIHTFLTDPAPRTTQVILDLRDRVAYDPRENEEGLLGLAFHPRFPETPEIFVYYTRKSDRHLSVVSRFDFDTSGMKILANTEDELLRIEQPFWNHNGGTLVFGPDGFLYVGLGDGGDANDPLKLAQDRRNWLGSILRLDVDQAGEHTSYSIPADNPFVGQADIRPEIWAYGFRNIWRMAFDAQTGELWAADVGQDRWEEINIVRRGGNYGWSLREGAHRFKRTGSDARDDLTEPVWEYDHRFGRSITGGLVYRGSKIPELQGCYLYGDYVSGRIWALRYDAQRKAPVANYALRGRSLPVMTFGAGTDGEIYFSSPLSGGRLFMIQPAADE